MESSQVFFWAVRWTNLNGDYPVWEWQSKDGAPVLYETEELAMAAAAEAPQSHHAEAIPIEFPPLPKWE